MSKSHLVNFKRLTANFFVLTMQLVIVKSIQQNNDYTAPTTFNLLSYLLKPTTLEFSCANYPIDQFQAAFTFFWQ